MIREVSFNGNRIRIFDDGNIWVFATDIAKLLGGANNVAQLTRNLSDSDIKRVDGHRTIVINEAGFYNMTAGKKNGSELRKFAEENIFKKTEASENVPQIFNSPEFGNVRIIEEGDKLWFGGTDVAKALGYINPRDAISSHCRYVVKRDVPHPQSSSAKIQMVFISEGDVYRLAARSKLPSAECFEKWLFDKVVPSIRKTGSYSVTGNTDDDILRQAFDILQRRNNEWQVKYEALLTERNNLQLQLDNVKKALGLNNDPSPEDPIDYIHHNRKILHNFLNTCIRSYTQKRLGSNSFGLGWSDFYNRLKKGLGQDIRLRGEPYIDHIADEEMSAAVYVANSMKPSTTYIEDETMAVVQKVLAA